MAPLEGEIYNALTTSTTLTALVGSRIYPIAMRQGTAYPAIVYRRTQGDRHYSLSGYTGLENPTVELEIHATAVVARRQTGDAAIGALSSATAFKGLAIPSPSDAYNDEVMVYTRVYDVSIWYGT